MILILFGVSGCGKTEVGKELAKRLRWEFVDGDVYHPQENIVKMQAGYPLTDEDRLPWLQKLAEIEREKIQKGENMVLACSALKEKYRKILNVDPKQCYFIYLKGEEDLIKRRLTKRKKHFMPSSLLQSQLESLEEPEGILTISIEKSIQEIVEKICSKLSITS